MTTLTPRLNLSKQQARGKAIDDAHRDRV